MWPAMIGQHQNTISPVQWIRWTLSGLLIPLILFLCAWDLTWWQGWVLSALIIAAGIGGSVWAESRHPGLLAERRNFARGPGAKAWDKVLSPLTAVSLSFPLIIVGGLDHRFSWSPVFPVWVNALGLILIASGYAFSVWAMAENRFFSTVVRIQTDRGHTVCDTGPYRFVRHPGYAGSVLALPGFIMAISSVWALLPAALALILTIIRTKLEDRTLQNELPGYQEYAAKVRYRLLPFVW